MEILLPGYNPWNSLAALGRRRLTLPRMGNATNVDCSANEFSSITWKRPWILPKRLLSPCRKWKIRQLDPNILRIRIFSNFDYTFIYIYIPRYFKYYYSNIKGEWKGNNARNKRRIDRISTERRYNASSGNSSSIKVALNDICTRVTVYYGPTIAASSLKCRWMGESIVRSAQLSATKKKEKEKKINERS